MSCDSAAGHGQHPIYFYPPKILREYYHWFYWQAIRSSIKCLERHFVPDLVMGYWLHPDGAAAVRAAKHFGVPSIVMSGGTDLRLLPQKPKRCRAILRVLDDADRLIVFSRELASQAESHGISRDKIDVVYRGIDRECFFPANKGISRTNCNLPQDGPVIFWAGRLEPVKNPSMLLHAAAEWKRSWDGRFHVVLAGDGPLRNQLHRLRSELQLETCIHFVGNLPQSKLAQYYNAADVTVLTSHSEGIPNVLLESIACETPFVATRVGGIPEIASIEMDRLVPAGDVNAFAQAVVQSIDTPPRGHRTFVPCDPVAMASQIQAVIDLCKGNSQEPKELTYFPSLNRRVS